MIEEAYTKPILIFNVILGSNNYINGKNILTLR